VITDLYVENNVGRAVLEAINLFTAKHGVTAVWQHDIHPQMQRRQFGDEWWIEDIASRGMAVLTQDSTLLGSAAAKQGVTTGERQAVIDSQAHVVALGNAKYSSWDKLRCLLNHWDAIDRLLRDDGPAAVTLYLTRVDVEQL
jgi:hypothetical protein